MKRLLILATFICLPGFASEPLNIPAAESIKNQRAQTEADLKWAQVDLNKAIRLLYACVESQKEVKSMELSTLKKIEEKKAAGIEISNEVIEQIQKNHAAHMPDCKKYYDDTEAARAKTEKLRMLSGQLLDAQVTQQLEDRIRDYSAKPWWRKMIGA